MPAGELPTAGTTIVFFLTTLSTPTAACQLAVVPLAAARHHSPRATPCRCMYAKGGSAYILVANNLVYNCGDSGIAAGQGTGGGQCPTRGLHAGPWHSAVHGVYVLL